MNETPQLRIYTGIKAWDTIWKWVFFAGPPSPDKEAGQALHSLLSPLKAKTVLDCSCGLGQTTFALADLGYRVEGADASGVAVKLSADLAAARHQKVRFFRSRWDKLSGATTRKYDCVYNDSFDWCPTRASMLASAKGIHSILKRGGSFVFWGDHQSSGGIKPNADAELRSAGRFEPLPTCERDGVKLTTIVSRERIPDGILGNRIHVIEERGTTRIEVASSPDIQRWVWQDYVDILTDVGFKKVYSHKRKGKGYPEYLNVAEK
jgi:SAM-dependent methyltransferase